MKSLSKDTVSPTGFNYSVDEISFNVSGDPGSLGFCNVSVPKALVKPGYTIKVYFDDKPVNYSLSENSTHYFIYFTYKHSTHRVSIRFEQGEKITPQQQDYTWPITVAAVSMAVIVAVFVLQKRRK